MGEQTLFQPLTRGDRLSVIIYRAGIAASTLAVVAAAYALFNSMHSAASVNTLLVALSISVGASVFSIHLYVGSFKKTLKRLYYFSTAAVLVLFVVGGGNAFEALTTKPQSFLLLIPLSGCLGFIAAKEAFCFKLLEGYILALFMPLYTIALSTGAVPLKSASYGLIAIAALLVIFTLRKVSMPLHYDIGDKSAYR
ncbi:MAG: DUF2301 domain-containing membrane protein [Thermodesulfovibrionales bacterium]|nr:DUF2301 domain-containing membrane protein [Thermodesulfovibrionales bacterium]